MHKAAVSQLEAPFSCAKLNECWREAGRLLLSWEASAIFICRLALWMSDLATSCASSVSDEYTEFFCKIRLERGLVTWREAKFRSGPCQRIKAIRQCKQVSLKITWRRSSTSQDWYKMLANGNLQWLNQVANSSERYVHLLDNPWTKAE